MAKNVRRPTFPKATEQNFVRFLPNAQRRPSVVMRWACRAPLPRILQPDATTDGFERVTDDIERMFSRHGVTGMMPLRDRREADQ